MSDPIELLNECLPLLQGARNYFPALDPSIAERIEKAITHIEAAAMDTLKRHTANVEDEFDELEANNAKLLKQRSQIGIRNIELHRALEYYATGGHDGGSTARRALVGEEALAKANRDLLAGLAEAESLKRITE